MFHNFFRVVNVLKRMLASADRHRSSHDVRIEYSRVISENLEHYLDYPCPDLKEFI